jgi:hypothetical protein
MTKRGAVRIRGGWVAAAVACGVVLQSLSHATEMPAAQDGAVPATVIEHLADPHPPLISYRALRTLTAETRGGKMRARLTAWTSLDPAVGFQYSVVDEEGSSIIREKVLHAALKTEQEMQALDTAQKAALTAANYEFAGGPSADEGLVQIGIRPKRRDTMLVEGVVLLTKPSGDLVRLEGVLSKRPSFWTREVRVVREYARIGGIRVPIAMQSVARVLLVGRSTFSMAYEYESINGSPVGNGTADVQSREQ